MKRTITFFTLVFLLALAIPFSTAEAGFNSNVPPSTLPLPRAANNVQFYVTAANNQTQLLVSARLASTVQESYINMNVTLQRYVNKEWESYKYYNAYEENVYYCVISETEDAPKGYYYRVALSFASSSIPGSGVLYSNSYYW